MTNRSMDLAWYRPRRIKHSVEARWLDVWRHDSSIRDLHDGRSIWIVDKTLLLVLWTRVRYLAGHGNHLLGRNAGKHL